MNFLISFMTGAVKGFCLLCAGMSIFYFILYIDYKIYTKYRPIKPTKSDVWIFLHDYSINKKGYSLHHYGPELVEITPIRANIIYTDIIFPFHQYFFIYLPFYRKYLEELGNLTHEDVLKRYREGVPELKEVEHG